MNFVFFLMESALEEVNNRDDSAYERILHDLQRMNPVLAEDFLLEMS